MFENKARLEECSAFGVRAPAAIGLKELVGAFYETLTAPSSPRSGGKIFLHVRRHRQSTPQSAVQLSREDAATELPGDGLLYMECILPLSMGSNGF